MADAIASAVIKNKVNNATQGIAAAGGEEEEKKLFSTLREKVALGVGLVGAGINAAHIGLAAAKPVGVNIPMGHLPNPIKAVAYTAGGTGIVFAPFVISNETKMAESGSFRTALNKMRDDVDNFHEENQRLTGEINKLESTVETMKEIESALTDLTTQQGSDLNNLMELIEENKIIAKKMREILRTRAIEDVITLVMQCDNDGNFELQGAEIEELILGLKLNDNIQIDEDYFRAQIAKHHGSVSAVLEIVKGLLDDESEDSVLKVKDSKELMSSTRDSVVKSKTAYGV
mmetsp:Transcript_15272/g.22485  ORF Transcript_15272/g.22485 Transcript_15272/m.22485 type:complete len:288 (+) Transcript_15272:137-1000(+)|eukprot:CAMPEP_0195525760 /NCGR_PEP_ID=MMETSP0794_2-20130614/26363_1 /TAXON_ID=515487 /ORGANISM="Stephanopyxis turris, Strain CCMP 815" /LENGTH=287 /DNA_ID=CAMNT_0040656291 /DNA_START=117 /DNA_END=980 /DNA_ORIENTATION=+